MNRSILNLALGLSFVFSGGAWALERVTAQDLFRARQLGLFTVTNDLGVVRGGKPWVFSANDRCNFTFFSPEIKDPTFADGKLSFTVTGKKGIVGWGNYDGRQAKAERIKMFPGWNDVDLKIKQSAEESEWTLLLWANGKTKVGTYSHEKLSWQHKPDDTVKVKGTDWQTIRFKAFKGNPDGFDLTIKGVEGNRVEIASFRVCQALGQGCYRYGFELPKGKIWRAAALVNDALRLYVNGKEVVFLPEALRHQGGSYVAVDLASYLEPGKKNAISLFAAQHYTALTGPDVYLQGSVIMESGERIVLDTSREWKAAPREEKGWAEVGFDDAGWVRPADRNPNSDIVKRERPCYDGRLLLLNPGKDPQLYFDAAGTLKLEARAPEGLAGEKPVLKWMLRKVGMENRRPEVARGEVKAFTKKDGSIVYEIDAGKQDQAVYTLQTSLFSADKELERRFEEPLMVIGRLDMPEVSGDSFEQGLELELEDVIDFTDADDPHRWVEAAPRRGEKTLGIDQPKIVRKDGLVYREVTDPALAAMFSYRFEFKHPHAWYLLVLEYPNDAERWIGFSVTSTGRVAPAKDMTPWKNLEPGLWNSEDGPSVITGGKYPLDHKMHELKWLHVADPEIHTVDIVNLKKDLRAAAARLKIYHVKKLPAVKINTSGERFLGIHTERSISLGRTFADSRGVDQYQRRYDHLDYDMIDRYTQRMRWYFDACKNYTAYLRFTGQNLHVAGSFQYGEFNPWPYVPMDKIPGSSHLLLDIREPLLRFFEHNGIAMYNMVEYVGHSSLKAHYAVGDAEVAEGAETIAFVNRDGALGGWHANPLHPAVEAGYLKVADDIAAKFAYSPAWKGIYYCIFIDGGGFGPGPCASHSDAFEYDYSDAAIRAFERDTGIAVPGAPTDPSRFRKRYLFLTSDALRDKWIAWRCQATKSYMTKTLEVLHKYRSDLNVLYGYHAGGNSLRYQLYESGKSYATYFREMGMDPAVVRNESQIWFGRYVYPMGASSGGAAYQWWNMINADANAMYYGHDGNRMFVLSTCWHELPTCAPGWIREGGVSTKTGTGSIEDIPKDWPLVANVSRFISQAHDDNVLEPFTLAMIGADPDMLIFGMTDVNLINSREQHMREVAKVVTALPKARFEPVQGTTDFKHNLAIRALSKGSAFWFYAANPAPWPLKAKVTLSGKGRVVRPCDGQAVETMEENGQTVVPIALAPYGLLAFKVTESGTLYPKTDPLWGGAGGGSNLQIVSWTNEPLPKLYVEHLEGIMRRVGELLENKSASLAITAEDRRYMRDILERGQREIKAGQYASAWTTLTDCRFWELWKDNLEKALEFSARLPGCPVTDLNPTKRPILDVAYVENEPPPVIDGKLNDAIWRKVTPSFRFLSIAAGGILSLGFPLVDTSVQSAYDKTNLYLAVRLADPDVTKLKKDAAPEQPVQVLRKYDDTVVMFFNPEGIRVRQFAANAGAVKYFSGSGEWGITADDLLEAPWDARVGVKDQEWVLEAAIPFSSLSDSAPAAGDTWRANFLRRFREFQVPESYWSRVRRWTDTEAYGTLVFR